MLRDLIGPCEINGIASNDSSVYMQYVPLPLMLHVSKIFAANLT